MKIRHLILATLFCGVGSALAQTTPVPNVPAYPIAVLAGSTRQIASEIVNTSTSSLASAAWGGVIDAGGTGYSSGDIGGSLCVTQGSASGACFGITGVSGGAITSIGANTFVFPGGQGGGHGYTLPAVGLATTGGSGTGATVTVTSLTCVAGGGFACGINWSVSGTGGAIATFTDPTHTAASTIAGGLPTMQVNFGTTAGTCSITGSTIGTYAVASTATVTVTAQSADDTSKSATFTFPVCSPPPCTSNALSNGSPCLVVAPAYQQAFRGQKMMLQSWLPGYVDETGTWSILTQPSGGDGALIDTGNRDTIFSATVTGRYVLKYTSHANSAISSTGIVYVSPNSLPSYVATPNKTVPRECYVDPAFTGTDYEIGAGKTYATLQASPAANTIAAGSIFRVWNTDTTGSSPSTFFENYQVHNNGTATQPIILCGVPDSSGNLPIIDGNNATMQSGFSTGLAGYGIITLWGGGYGGGTPFQYWQAGSAGPSYINITGLHLRNGTPAFNFAFPGTGVSTPYVVGASCANLRAGAYIDVSGDDLDTCTNGVFTAENANSAWGNVTQAVTIVGNHIHGSGWSTDSTEHQTYFQSFYGLYEGNLLDNYLPTAAGSNVKWRGVEGIFRYNNLATGPARDLDLVDNQDSPNYMTLEGYLSNPGQTDCNTSFYCTGDTAGAAVIAMYQESAQKDFVYGNIIFGASSQDQIHYAEDHDSGMADKNGVLYFYSNTLDQAQQVFDTGSSAGYNPFLQQRVYSQNNIFWPKQTGANAGIVSFNRYQSIIYTGITNLMQTGSFNNTTPITGGNWNAGGAAIGWSSGCDSVCYWPLTSPINPHVYSLLTANYLATGTQPYNSTTMIPPSGSAAIGAGSSLSGVLATMPVRWNFSTATNSLTARVFPLTAGGEDQAGTSSGGTTLNLGTYSGNVTINGGP